MYNAELMKRQWVFIYFIIYSVIKIKSILIDINNNIVINLYHKRFDHINIKRFIEKVQQVFEILMNSFVKPL